MSDAFIRAVKNSLKHVNVPQNPLKSVKGWVVTQNQRVKASLSTDNNVLKCRKVLTKPVFLAGITKTIHIVLPRSAEVYVTIITILEHLSW